MKPPVFATALAALTAASVIALAQPPEPQPAPGAAAPGRGAGGAGRGAGGRGAGGAGRGAGGPAATPGTTIAAAFIAQGDKNADQKLSSAEISALADAWYTQFDPENAGRVSQQEFLIRFDGVMNPQPPAPIVPAAGAAPAGGAAPAAGGRGGRGGGGGRGGVPGGATGGNGLAFMSVVDTNRNSSLTRDELKGTFEKWLPLWDADKDGALSAAELARGLDAVLPRNNTSGTQGIESTDYVAGIPKPTPSPELSAADSMKTMQVAPGFKIELAAVEPMVQDPVAMTFDEDGRAYVVEMIGYMLDIDRTKEGDPICRISRLEDTDGDGKFDKSTIFVDELILPRAVAASRGGIFYVSNYQLYFAQDTNGDGKADRKELVDANYGRGNVEHAPNSFFRAMDNWVYNGESPTRYRLVGNTLVRGTTETRGQWGMTQDNYGRLLYNVNNSQLLGDYTPANYMGRNANHQASSGINLFVSTDQRVFPIRMNTAINRGYSPEVINPVDGKAFVFASSCAPLVYRGDNFPAEFVNNAFVADPALNLVKRNILSDDNLTLTSRFAYENREFLAATDERFRPSNLYNGPDGALWVVDLYRGIAQYGQFMTAYLKRDTLERGLDKGIHYGRIYRIVSDTKKPAAFPKLSAENNTALVGRLSHANGWIRDTAQRLLIERGDRAVTNALVGLIAGNGDPLARIHALWTLEGLYTELPAAPAADDKLIRLQNAEAGFALRAPAVPTNALEAVIKAISDANPKVQVAAIRVAESFASGNATRQQAVIGALTRLAAATPEEVLFQAALSAGNLGKTEALPLLVKIATSSSEHLIVRDAIISSLQGSELAYLQALVANAAWNDTRPGRPALLQALASAIIKERDPAKVGTLLALTAEQKPAQAWRARALADGIASNAGRPGVRPIAFTKTPAGIDALSKAADAQQVERIKSLFSWPGHQQEETAKAAVRPLTAEESALFAQGQTVYTTLCFACHGPTGQGMTPLGPPLANSEWTLGSDERLVRIVLQGVSGPIMVGGTRYAPPMINPEMPGLGAALNDTQVAGVLTFIRRSWNHEADPITPAKVAAIRAATTEQKGTWTPEQLQAIK